MKADFNKLPAICPHPNREPSPVTFWGMHDERWHKIALIALAIAIFPFGLRILFPNYFEAARCVAMLPNGDVVKARGDECKNPAFESVVIIGQDDDSNIQVEGDAVVEP